MECLPLVMQLSLFLLGYGLAQYLRSLGQTISAVLATFTPFGVLSCLLLAFAATFWKTYPFQTPGHQSPFTISPPPLENISFFG